MSMTIIEFLNAHIAEDEAAARAVLEKSAPDGWDNPTETGNFWREEVEFWDRFDPERVLAECAAKRGILAEYEGLTFESRSVMDSWEPYRSVMRNTLAQMAKVYESHPDYDKGWECDLSDL